MTVYMISGWIQRYCGGVLKKTKVVSNYPRMWLSKRHISYVSFGSIKNFSLPNLVVDGSNVENC